MHSHLKNNNSMFSINELMNKCKKLILFDIKYLERIFSFSDFIINSIYCLKMICIIYYILYIVLCDYPKVQCLKTNGCILLCLDVNINIVTSNAYNINYLSCVLMSYVYHSISRKHRISYTIVIHSSRTYGSYL